MFLKDFKQFKIYSMQVFCQMRFL